MQKLGELLIERARLGGEQLERALKLQEESGERLGSLLVRMGLLAERDLAETLAEQLGLDLAAAADFPETPVGDGEVSPEFLQRAKALPMALEDDSIVVAMADPGDTFTVDALALAMGHQVIPRVGIISDIEAGIRRLYRDGASEMDEMVDSFDEGAEDEDVQQLKDLASEAPVIRVVNLIVNRALEARASDIHIEPFERKLKVRYRIDGVLKEVEAPPVQSTAAVISRIKVMAHLNIAERRLPQDGRIKLRMAGREFDMRVSTVPTMHGESVVMRILDRSHVPLEFEALGYGDVALKAFRTMLERPHGIVLLTGPTGSGKTTTLYAALQSLNTPSRKILTVEDPVEYQLEGINQIQVKPAIGLSFADALRSILRQDPDVIMVGEMRDLETSRIAVQAALTGHKVFSTLHTNDAPSSVTRMLDMGIEDYLLTSTVNGVVAQRLIRRLCDECKAPRELLPELARELGLEVTGERGPTVYEAVGCEACEETGFYGRTGILELLVMTDPVRRAVLDQGEASAIRAAALEEGMVEMHADGLRKVLAGITTLEEVERVTHET